jgi:hypothetical protein
MLQDTMLYHTLDRSRWFIVPVGLELPAGELTVRSFSRLERPVQAEALQPHEVDMDAAKQWIDGRFREAFGRVGGAFDKLVSRVRETGRTVPDLSGAHVRVEEVLGASPGEVYTDPARAREAIDALFSWASEKMRPPGERPDLAQTLTSVGEALAAAAQKLRERRAKPQLSRVGFFRELRHGDPEGPSLASCQREHSGPHEDELVRYLQQAPVLIASPGPVGDVLDPTAGPVGTPSIHSDGVWCWPGDLAHYVRRYHVTLPREFLEHLVARGWEPEAG